MHTTPLPSSYYKLLPDFDPSSSWSNNNTGTSHASHGVRPTNQEDISDADDTGFEEDDEMDDVNFYEFNKDVPERKKDDEEYAAKCEETLQKVRQRNMVDTLQGINTGSVCANDRLMKELRDIYRSESFRTGIFGRINR
jgi:ubiquitin-conjugating enzyme E2 Q